VRPCSSLSLSGRFVVAEPGWLIQCVRVRRLIASLAGGSSAAVGGSQRVFAGLDGNAVGSLSASVYDQSS
jgi:hypothetical protein